jgi:hypothetical protein
VIHEKDSRPMAVIFAGERFSVKEKIPKHNGWRKHPRSKIQRTYFCEIFDDLLACCCWGEAGSVGDERSDGRLPVYNKNTYKRKRTDGRKMKNV